MTNDLLLNADSGNCSILVLLDLSAAFDTVDHDLLIKRLEHWVGIRGMALNWFASYIKNRTFRVNIGAYSSALAIMSSGVPQGSILGPLLFTLYMLPLGQIIQKYNISFHCYADDLQLYMPLSLSNQSCLTGLNDCILEIKNWMAHSFLQLNESKTEVILFGPPKKTDCLKGNLGPLSPFIKSQVRNLGVLFDTELKFDKQINAVVKGSFFQLRAVAKLKSFLTESDFEKVIHAFITTRLDYCNALYTGVSESSLSHLQLVQNAAARLLTGTRRREHISPILEALHWLPVKYRILYKIALTVFKALNGLAPLYVMDMLCPYTQTRSLRSASQSLLYTPRSRLTQKGDRAFSVFAPKLWNSLPSDLRSATSVISFKSSLKTHLFRLAYDCL